MSHKLVAVALSFALVFFGCASQRGWHPAVDPHNDPNAGAIEFDLRECDALARQAAGDSAAEASEGALFGAMIGAVFGAIFGAIFGDPGTGAAVGATMGGLEGGAQHGLSAEEQFQRAYIHCMRNRGHNVIN